MTVGLFSEIRIRYHHTWPLPRLCKLFHRWVRLNPDDVNYNKVVIPRLERYIYRQCSRCAAREIREYYGFAGYQPIDYSWAERNAPL